MTHFFALKKDEALGIQPSSETCQTKCPVCPGEASYSCVPTLHSHCFTLCCPPNAALLFGVDPNSFGPPKCRSFAEDPGAGEQRQIWEACKWPSSMEVPEGRSEALLLRGGPQSFGSAGLRRISITWGLTQRCSTLLKTFVGGGFQRPTSLLQDFHCPSPWTGTTGSSKTQLDDKLQSQVH